MKWILITIVLILVGCGSFFIFESKNASAPVAVTNPDITVSSPMSGALVTSPLTITGEARGTWYFEASFPVILQDSNGNVLAQAPAQAQSDWETSDFVPFVATLTFTPPQTTAGVLILKNDNPSGNPSNQKQISIPVRFTR